MAKIEHFEVPADDVDRAQAFYAKAFGFTYEPWGEDMGMLRTGSDEGIGGDIHKRGAVSHPTFVITVDDLEGALASVVAAGGEQFGEITSLGETARYAYLKDS